MTMRELPGEDFRALQSPAVYIYEDANGGALYVGSGTTGASRAFQVSPGQQPLRVKAQQECSRVRFVVAPSLEALPALERELIHSLHPKYNAACPTCDHYPVFYGTRNPRAGRRAATSRTISAGGERP